MSINENMIIAVKALRAGASEHVISLLLLQEGYTEARVQTMIQWCKRYNKKEIDDE
jgi:hypothetical protein